MSRMRSFTTAGTTLLLMMGAHSGASDEAAIAADITRAASNFVAALSDEQRTRATFALDSELRLDWHYIPKRDRKGLSFRDMSADQAQLAHVLLSTSLSRSGYRKTLNIMSLETVLRNLEKERGQTMMLALRDPELYFVSIFGDPTAGGSWGWSVEGHHVSLNFTVVGGQVLASTPTFLGSNPHQVQHGPRAGLRPLEAEEDLARRLLSTLDEEQLGRALIATKAPNDIVTRAERMVDPDLPARGLSAALLSPDQRDLLRALVLEYAHNVPPEIAAKRTRQLDESGEDLWFVWMGSLEPGPGTDRGHYYRVQTSSFLIEYDNVQNQANHSHSVWRDYQGDWGHDLLLEHHRHGHGVD